MYESLYLIVTTATVFLFEKKICLHIDKINIFIFVSTDICLPKLPDYIVHFVLLVLSNICHSDRLLKHDVMKNIHVS